MTLSRIGAIGDVHAEDQCLDEILGYLASCDLDQVYCVGDIVDGIGSVDRCCELLNSHKVSTVLGNHDQWCMENINRGIANATAFTTLRDVSRAFLQSLPRTVTVKTVGGSAMICHGLGEYNMASVRPSDSTEEITDNLELWALYRNETLRFVINGHSHQPDLHHFDHLTIVNVGTLSRPNAACFAMIDFEESFVDFYRLSESGQIENCMSKHFDRASGDT